MSRPETPRVKAEGPFFNELAVGQTFPPVPGVTLTDGLAAAHQAIVGNRLPLSLDGELARAVTGGGRLASPALVWDVAIGQSTVATHHVKANLFYRGLWFHRAPVTFPSSTDSDPASVFSRTSPPCRVTTSASARHSPIVPSGWKPNRLNALLRVK